MDLSYCLNFQHTVLAGKCQFSKNVLSPSAAAQDCFGLLIVLYDAYHTELSSDLSNLDIDMHQFPLLICLML